MKLLLIEDEIALRNTLVEYLRQNGYVCEVAGSFEQALEKVKLYDYDCVVLDLTLPGTGNGLDILRTLKADGSRAGVLIISARASLDDRLTGLDLGADDYLTKPFHLAELNSRLRAIIRRRQFQGHHHIAFRDLVVWPEQAEVFVREQPLTLTRKEYDLLLFLLTNPNRVLTKEAIAEHLCGDAVDAADSFDFIYTHLKNLRKKLQEKGADNYIRTMYGVGYKLSFE
ncbi:response regulator transcription factor [Hymenobacter psychrophilus]|uniref:DNA-binding response regulator, OmpR family, contains REC and winged-helix (WHTH) domain n=1 Tax=Hymenobacter psychrophilus TaxID=651662 RepID=A0A1H3B9K7_9BACT|nr:response regulator transcription factor [Hymenobacter psychrophilus]SDX38613.1 DNA-binding response regulator, OmpR family, contains REC and winged-helix (wHTH) domain [Hymenobacter psychrophilus]